MLAWPEYVFSFLLCAPNQVWGSSGPVYVAAASKLIANPASSKNLYGE
ncbi:hypothetical protein OROGR_007892 [Orobanche gracilis]